MKPRFFHRLARSVRNNVFIGLVLITPVGVTLLLINLLFKYATGFLPERFLDSPNAVFFRIGALALVAVLLFLIGLFARNFIGRRLYRLGDRVFMKTPFVNRIYMAVRQISEAFLAQRDTFFQQAVLIEYPREGVYAIGFVASRAPGAIRRALPQEDQPVEYRGVFIPTTPNPTSGFFVIVSSRQLVPLSMTVTEAMKLVVSGGAYDPESDYTGRNLTLLDKLENWFKADSMPHAPHDA